MNTKLKLLSGLLIAGLANSANANLITEWSYTNQAGFEANYTQTSNTTKTSDDVVASGNSATGNAGDALTVNTGNILNTDGNWANGVSGDNALSTQLTWGTPAEGPNSGDPRSSLGIDSPVVDTMGTNDFAWAQGTAITHENWVIVGDSLTTASILDGLALTPTNWVDKGVDSAKDSLLEDNAPYFAPQLEFGINFLETPNKGVDSNGFCPNGELNNQGDNINGCGDIFEITGLENLPLVPVVGADFIEFTVPFILVDANGAPLAGWNDVEYFVTTRLSGLTSLPAGYPCLNQANCFGFVTVEQQTNVLNAEFKISTVPEPTTLAIFGLGLLATGLSGRRKRNV
jgi:hypothetical protein|tara:strand:- start:23826 stop:24857 length:1032 start_codon:yes stop_codon:yes gene_type:complete